MAEQAGRPAVSSVIPDYETCQSMAGRQKFILGLAWAEAGDVQRMRQDPQGWCQQGIPPIAAGQTVGQSQQITARGRAAPVREKCHDGSQDGIGGKGMA